MLCRDGALSVAMFWHDIGQLVQQNEDKIFWPLLSISVLALWSFLIPNEMGQAKMDARRWSPFCVYLFFLCFYLFFFSFFTQINLHSSIWNNVLSRNRRTHESWVYFLVYLKNSWPNVKNCHYLLTCILFQTFTPFIFAYHSLFSLQRKYRKYPNIIKVTMRVIG